MAPSRPSPIRPDGLESQSVNNRCCLRAFAHLIDVCLDCKVQEAPLQDLDQLPRLNYSLSTQRFVIESPFMPQRKA